MASIDSESISCSRLRFLLSVSTSRSPTKTTLAFSTSATRLIICAFSKLKATRDYYVVPSWRIAVTSGVVKQISCFGSRIRHHIVVYYTLRVNRLTFPGGDAYTETTDTYRYRLRSGVVRLRARPREPGKVGAGAYAETEWTWEPPVRGPLGAVGPGRVGRRYHCPGHARLKASARKRCGRRGTQAVKKGGTTEAPSLGGRGFLRWGESPSPQSSPSRERREEQEASDGRYAG